MSDSDDDEDVRSLDSSYSSQTGSLTGEDDFSHLDAVDKMAVALSPPNKSGPVKISRYGHPTSPHTTLIKKVKECTVYQGPSVIHNHYPETPDPTPVLQRNTDADYINAKAQYLKPLYVETKAFKECLDVLDSENALFITGNPGTGKTSMAVMVTKKLMETGFKVVRILSPKDWKKVVQSAEDEKVVAFIDDMFGSTAVDERKVNGWLQRNGEIASALREEDGKIKVICTLRKKLYKETLRRLERFQWYRGFRVVDLSSAQYEMDSDGKRILMEKYFDHFEISERKRCYEAIEIDTPHGFPHCVELYCTEHNYRRTGLNFFKGPMKIVEQEIQIIQEMRSIEFYVLLLILLSPNQKLEEEAVTSLKLDEKLLNQTRILSLIPTRDAADIVGAIRNLIGIYLEEFDDGSIGFKHDSLRDTIALVAIKFNPIPAVISLDMVFLSEKTKYLAYNAEDRSEYAVLPKKCTRHLVIRITDAILNGEASSACKHHAWDDTSFVTAWLSYVKDKKSSSNVNRTILEELLTEPVDTFTVKVEGEIDTVPVSFLFFLFLHQKQAARDEIMRVSENKIREDHLKLSKFKREHRCSSNPETSQFSKLAVSIYK